MKGLLALFLLVLGITSIYLSLIRQEGEDSLSSMNKNSPSSVSDNIKSQLNKLSQTSDFPPEWNSIYEIKAINQNSANPINLSPADLKVKIRPDGKYILEYSILSAAESGNDEQKFVKLELSNRLDSNKVWEKFLLYNANGIVSQ